MQQRHAHRQSVSHGVVDVRSHVIDSSIFYHIVDQRWRHGRLRRAWQTSRRSTITFIHLQTAVTHKMGEQQISFSKFVLSSWAASPKQDLCRPMRDNQSRTLQAGCRSCRSVKSDRALKKSQFTDRNHEKSPCGLILSWFISWILRQGTPHASNQLSNANTQAANNISILNYIDTTVLHARLKTVLLSKLLRCGRPPQTLFRP